MKSHKTPKSNCLSCGYKCDAASCMTGSHPPRPGDITICLKCGHIMAFGDDLRLRELTAKEIIDVAGNKDVIRVQKARGIVKPWEKL